MTARKLLMPGLRERTTGEGVGAGDGGGRGGLHPQDTQQPHNCNGSSAAAGAGGQGCCANCSSQAGLASSMMQPLPLASRCAAANHDSLHSASSALGSSWIRRFLPSTPDVGSGETRQETAPEHGPVRGGGVPDSSSHPMVPFLLALAPKDNPGEQDAVMAEGRMVLDGSREASVKVSGNGPDMHKGKALQERGSGHATTSVAHDLGENDIRRSHRKVATLLNHSRTYLVEGNRRQQQQLESNHGAGVSVRGESHVNGTSGAMVTGFGSIRAVLDRPTSDFTKVGGGGSSRLKVPVMVGGTEVKPDVPAAAQCDFRPPSNATILDRKLSSTQTMAPPGGTKFTPPLKSTGLDDVRNGTEFGRPSRAVEFASPWRLPKAKKQEVESDGLRRCTTESDGARETAAAFGASKGAVEPSSPRFKLYGADDFTYRRQSGSQNFLDHGTGVERTKTGCNNYGENSVTAYGSATNPGKKEDIGDQGTEIRHHNRAVVDDCARLNSGAGFPTAVESRKMKEVVGCEFTSRRSTNVGPSQQQQAQVVPLPPPHQFQRDTCIYKVGYPLPFSPRSSFPLEENLEDTRNSRSKAEDRMYPSTGMFGAPMPHENGLGGRPGQGQSGPPAPRASLFNPFKGQKHQVQSNSTPSTPRLPPDLRSVLREASMQGNRPSESPKANDSHYKDAIGGEREGTERHFFSSPSEARGRFDDQSSHFSSSPWPENESHVPNDDGGSGPYNSQATGSAYQTQASRVANRSASDAKERHGSSYGHDKGGERLMYDTTARSRDVYATETDLRKSAGSLGEDARRPQMFNEDDQTHGSPSRLRHYTMQGMSSGRKDDTSGSSPPSIPVGYNNSSDLGSPILPRSMFEDPVLKSTGQSRTSEVDPELEVPRRQNGFGSVGFEPMRPRENMTMPKHTNGGVYRAHRDSSTFLRKDTDLQNAQSTVRDMYGEISRPDRSNEAGETGLKHGKLRTSGEAMEEYGISGPAKRTCHHPNVGSRDVSSQADGSGIPSSEQGNADGSGKSSSWLRRWLPPSNGDVAKTAALLSISKDELKNGSAFKPPRSHGNKNLLGLSFDRIAQLRNAQAARGKGIDARHESKVRNGVKDISAKRRVNGLPPSYPTPSAAAMALVGPAARKSGPLPQQRRGSVAMWPSVHLQTAHTPDSQESPKSSEQPVYME